MQVDSTRGSLNRAKDLISQLAAWPFHLLRLSEAKGPALYTGTSVGKSLAMTISSLIVARMVMPEDLGTWQGVALILTYIGFLEFGVLKGLNRQYALYRGAGETQLALEHAWSGGTYTLIWTVVDGLIMLLLVGIAWARGSDYKTLWALLFLILPGLTRPFESYYEVIYRSGDDFWELGRIQIVEIAYIMGSILFVYWWGWIGLFIRFATLSPLGVGLRYLRRPISFQLRWNWDHIVELAKIGLKVVVGAYIYGLIMVADNTLVLALFGQEALGNYVVASTAETAIMVVPAALAVVIYARMAFRYGQSGRVDSLRRLAFLPVIFNAIFLLIPVVLLCWFIGPAINWLLPQYAMGIPAARWTVLAGYFLCLTTSATVFTTLNRMREYTLLICVTLGVVYLSGWLAARQWGTLESIAAARAVSLAIYAIGVNLLAFWLLAKGEKREQ